MYAIRWAGRPELGPVYCGVMLDGDVRYACWGGVWKPIRWSDTDSSFVWVR